MMRKRDHHANAKSGFLIGFVQNDAMRLRNVNFLSL